MSPGSSLYRRRTAWLGVGALLLPARLLGQHLDGTGAGVISAIDSRSGSVTVVSEQGGAQRFEFQVADSKLRARLRPGHRVTVDLRSGTGRLGGQTIRIAGVITSVGVMTEVRAVQLCAAEAAALNAIERPGAQGDRPVRWNCAIRLVPRTTEYVCSCVPTFSPS